MTVQYFEQLGRWATRLDQTALIFVECRRPDLENGARFALR